MALQFTTSDTLRLPAAVPFSFRAKFLLFWLRSFQRFSNHDSITLFFTNLESSYPSCHPLSDTRGSGEIGSCVVFVFSLCVPKGKTKVTWL